MWPLSSTWTVALSLSHCKVWIGPGQPSLGSVCLHQAVWPNSSSIFRTQRPQVPCRQSLDVSRLQAFHWFIAPVEHSTSNDWNKQILTSISFYLLTLSCTLALYTLQSFCCVSSSSMQLLLLQCLLGFEERRWWWVPCCGCTVSQKTWHHVSFEHSCYKNPTHMQKKNKVCAEKTGLGRPSSYSSKLSQDYKDLIPKPKGCIKTGSLIHPSMLLGISLKVE